MIVTFHHCGVWPALCLTEGARRRRLEHLTFFLSDSTYPPHQLTEISDYTQAEPTAMTDCRVIFVGPRELHVVYSKLHYFVPRCGGVQ